MFGVAPNLEEVLTKIEEINGLSDEALGVKALNEGLGSVKNKEDYITSSIKFK